MMMKTTFFMSTFFWNGFTSGVEKIWYTCINPFENWLSFSGQKSTLQNPWPANFCCFFYGRPWSCRRAPTISLCRSSSSTLPCLASKLTWVPRWTFRRTRCLEVCLRVRAVYAKCFCFVSEFKRSDPNPWSSSSLYIYIYLYIHLEPVAPSCQKKTSGYNGPLVPTNRKMRELLLSRRVPDSFCPSQKKDPQNCQFPRLGGNL